MICPNCQKETAQGNCCMHCGAVLNASSIPSVTTGAANSQPKKKKGGSVIAIIAVVIAAICIIASFIPSGPTGNAVLELKEADGSVATSTYYYKNDVVYKMIDSYTKVYAEGLSDTDAALLKAQIELEYAAAKGLSSCVLTCSHDETSFTITITYTDLDQAATIVALENANLLETSGGADGDLISYTNSKNALLADGYTLVSENN